MRIVAPTEFVAKLPSGDAVAHAIGGVFHDVGTAINAAKYATGAFVGAAKEAASTGANLINIPIYTRHGGWFRVQGVMWDPSSKSQRAGAAAIDVIAKAVGLLAKPADRAAERARRPLILTTSATGDANRATTLRFTGTAAGANWGDATKTAGVVSVYVDGNHAGDALVLTENPEPISLNLGVLGAGTHSIELRDASVDAPGTVRSTVSAVQTPLMSVDDTLVAKYQPLIEGRDLGKPNALGDMTSTDAPLLMAPTVTTHPDGSHTIRYFTLFSNEDGGTSTQRLYRDYGRGTDFEHLYTVQVDPNGKRTGSWYQGPLHAWRAFGGTFVGDRAVLRIGTSNNMATERSLDAGAVWSPETLPIGQVPRSLKMMLDHPWTFKVMGGELVRQDRVEPELLPDPLRIEDPRRYVYMPSSGDETRRILEQGGSVTLVLKDGTTRQLHMDDAPSRRPENETAIPLPDTLHGDDIAGIRGARGSVWVLSAELDPRKLTVGA